MTGSAHPRDDRTLGLADLVDGAGRVRLRLHADLVRHWRGT